MNKFQLLFFVFILTSTSVFSQKIILDGYAFEEYNRGFLNEVKVTIFDVTGILIGETQSGMDGHFVYDGVDPGREYIIQYEKKIFKTIRDTFSTVGKKAGEKVFFKQQIERQPGYLLEVTLAEKRINTDLSVDAINGCRIEIFNMTKNKEELVIDSAKSPVFSVTLQQGNQYTVMVRKKGFFTKRMDANVNINGCYLCMDGFGTVSPGVTSNLTSAEDNKLGTLLSNIELEPIDTNRKIVIQNIYYASASSELALEARKELDKIISLMKNNPALIIELGSHTDSRGSEVANLKLSQDRAQAAVNYITASGWIESARVKAKGYGESRLTNKCEDGTPCNDEEHIKNRRTELKIIGFGKDPHEGLSLAEIVHQEEMMRFVLSGESDKQYAAPTSYAATPQTPTLETPKKEIEKPKAASTTTTPTTKNPTVSQTVASSGNLEPNNKQATSTTTSSSQQMTMKDLESTASKNLPKNTTPSAANKEKLATPPSVKQASEAAAKNQEASKLEKGGISIASKSATPTPVAVPESQATPVKESPKVAESPKNLVAIPKETVKINLFPIDKTFAGYKIELFTSKNELQTSSTELKTIAQNLSSDIYFEKLADGQFSYMVGTFLGWSETERFLEKVQPQYPQARILDYYNGKRIGQ